MEPRPILDPKIQVRSGISDDRASTSVRVEDGVTPRPQLNASGMEHLRAATARRGPGFDVNRMVVEFTMLNPGKVLLCAVSTAAMHDLEGRRDVKPNQRAD